MKTKQMDAESFMTAFHGLPKSQRTAVVALLVKDDEFGADLEDIALIQEARHEKSDDVPLDSYVRSRVKDGR